MRYHVVTTDEFNRWLARIRDRQAAKAIAQRLDRVVAGNLGDVKPVGQGVSEMRIEGLSRIAFGGDGLLLGIEPFAVRALGADVRVANLEPVTHCLHRTGCTQGQDLF